MTTEETTYADRCYRSGGALVGGVLLLALLAWLTGDAMLRGEGRTPLTAFAVLVAAVPLIFAFTLRPAVFAGDRLLRVRNPFRTVTVPWGSVGALRAGYSNEVVVDGVTYQLWSIPVSLRDRKKANRHNSRLKAGKKSGGALAALQGRSGEDEGPRQATSDQSMDELRALAEQHADQTCTPTVRWAYEIIVPAVVGCLGLLFLVVTG